MLCGGGAADAMSYQRGSSMECMESHCELFTVAKGSDIRKGRLAICFC